MHRKKLLFAALACLFLAAPAWAASAVSPSDAPNATPSLLRELARGTEEIPILIGIKDGTPSAHALAATPDPTGEPDRRLIRLAAQQSLAGELTPRRLAVKHYYENFSVLAGTATREAAMVPQVAIHCIIRPPWICPGAPACSGNTQFTISVAVSEIESMVGVG